MSLIERFRKNQDERPIREALRDELDRLSATKKTRTTRPRQQSITANEIYMQDKDDKIYISSRSNLITVKIDKLPDNIRKALFDLLDHDTGDE